MKRSTAFTVFSTLLLLAASLLACNRSPDPYISDFEGTSTDTPDNSASLSTVTTYDPSHSTTPPVTTTLPVTDTPVTAPPVTDVPVTDVPPIPTIGETEFTDSHEIGYTLDNLTVLDGSGKTALGKLVIRQTVLITGTNDDWVRIRYQDKIGYLPAESISLERPSVAIAASDACGGIVYPGDSRVVAIDAGHQGKGMKETEPNGPGSDVMKAMLSTGTQGVSTRIPEYQLNLDVALLLRDELIARGYTVVMIRESNDVTLSNSQRALIANKADAGAFVRIHANGSTDRSVQGALTLCQTAANPYNGNLYDESYRLSDTLLDGFIASTGMKELPIWETDTMTGINWAEVPSTIIEMGYMSNADEDEKMETDAFKKAAAIGMADGLDVFFAN